MSLIINAGGGGGEVVWLGGVVPNPSTFEASVEFEDDLFVETISSPPGKDLTFNSSTFVWESVAGLIMFKGALVQRLVSRAGVVNGVSQIELGGGNLSHWHIIGNGAFNQTVMAVRDTYGRQVIMVDAPFYDKDWNIDDKGFCIFGTAYGNPDDDNTLVYWFGHNGTDTIRDSMTGAIQDFESTDNQDGYRMEKPIEKITNDDTPLEVARLGVAEKEMKSFTVELTYINDDGTVAGAFNLTARVARADGGNTRLLGQFSNNSHLEGNFGLIWGLDNDEVILTFTNHDSLDVKLTAYIRSNVQRFG